MLGELLKAIKIAGSRNNLAKAIGTTTDAINAWLNRGINVPLEYAFEIERLTNGRVKWTRIAPHLAHFEKRWSKFKIVRSCFATHLLHMPLSKIICSEGITKPHSEIKKLTKNIKLNGLKHPICIDTENNLIFGKSRLYAYKFLKKKTIVSYQIDLTELICGKYSLTEITQIFKASERVLLGLAAEKHLSTSKNSKIRQVLLNKRRRDDLLAKNLGFGNRQTYSQAKKVFSIGSRELITAIDTKKLAIHTAAILAKFPFEQQKNILKWPKKKIIAFIKNKTLN